MNSEIVKGFVTTQDNVRIAYEHVRQGKTSLIVVCPGFFNSLENRRMQDIKSFLMKDYDVLVFSFRGHGMSQGLFTWTAKEPYDLMAIMKYLEDFQYQKTGIVGLSLGAATTINCLSRLDYVSSVILISGPFSFWDINYHFWEPEMFSDLMDNMDCGWQGKGARLGNIFMRKRKPLNEIQKIQKKSMLFIHGEKDWIIKPYHSERLFQAAAVKNKKLKIIKKGLHAERLIQQYPQKMKKMIIDWFKETL